MHKHDHPTDGNASEKDPVCGMDVNREVAAAAGLSAEHQGTAYYFCGRGCLLDFTDEPHRFFNPDYVPHM